MAISPRSVLGLTLAAIIALGVIALCLVNVPPWAAVAAGLLAGALVAVVARWAGARRHRQKTEA